MSPLLGVFLLLVLTASMESSSDPGAADGNGPSSAALVVFATATPDAVLLHIQASGDVEPGSVEVRFAGLKTVVLARDAAGHRIRSRALRLPGPVVEEGSSADYDADGVLVMTLRKQPTGDLRAAPPLR
jgi:hypothetical protein